ncbi:cytochrome P450 [Laetiporus sulphureus 93-53]|uniref:Cytochrome P450 n=1 Tax=Laetiporus sulphureus 93-53 TaxID=1314785 RepID=A0A165ICR4_9APHY|nr:cytochrome P450 [Laetiporus sulphureus 93-53]KZT12901.1 cytochrome P450 [Laetiporus sulphureus 93-53]
MLFVALFDVGAALLAIFLTARIVQRRRSASAPHLPPGPKGWPMLGNLLDLPISHEWKTFSEWSDRWGDIMSIQLLNQPIVIISSSTRAMEMLEKKSAIYSDRPTLTVAGEMIGWDHALALHHYGSRWRETRRLHAQFIGNARTQRRYQTF